MASITFSGQLDQAMNEAAAEGNKILFIPQQTVGEVLPGAASELVVESDGLYSITLSYNTYSIYHYSDITKRRTLLATDIVVSADTAVSTIPDLIGSTVPVTEDSVLTIQGYLTEAQDSATAAAASESAVTNRVSAYEVESTDYLINTFDGSDLETGDVVRTLGYYTAGDGGGAEWVKTGETGTVSQSPSDNYSFKMENITINDTAGNVFNLTVDALINPVKFGAKSGDESFDNYIVFNLFFAYIRYRAQFGQITSPNTLEDGDVSGLIPPGRYYCSTSIEATRIRGVGWTVLAHGVSIYGADEGYPVIDMLGSRWGTLVGLKVIGDSTTSPRCGIQYGRTTTASYSCDNMHFDRCKTDGYFSLASLYNLASETETHTHSEYYNAYDSSDSYVFVNDGNNYWGATSRYIDSGNILSGNQSMSNIQHTFLGTDFRKTTSGPVVWMSKANQTKYYNSYVVTKDDAAIVVSDDGNGFNDTLFDIHFETSGITDCVRFEKQTVSSAAYLWMRNFEFIDHAPFASNSIFSIDSDLSRVIMDGSQVRIPRLGYNPTYGLCDDPTKLYITGSVYLPSNSLINAFRLFGSLNTDAISSVSMLPYGDYVATDGFGNVVYKGTMSIASSTSGTPTGSDALSTNAEMQYGTLKLESKSTLEFIAEAGVIVVDDGTNWTGVNSSGSPRPVFYDGTSYIAMT